MPLTIQTATLLQLKGCCGPEYHVVLSKQTADPLTLEGFLYYEANLANALEEITTAPAAHLSEKLEEAVADKGLLGLLGRYRLNRKVNAALKTFADELLAVAPALAADHQVGISRDTRKQVKRQWFSKQLTKSAVQKDAQQEFFLRSNALFMGKFLNGTLPERAKKIILKAYKDIKGQDHEEKLAHLQAKLTEGLGVLPDAPKGYWGTFSANALNNARTYEALKTISTQTGVVGFRIQGVQDSRQSNICRRLNGRVFPVQQALQRFEKMFQATSLDEIRRLSPMVQGTAQSGFYYTLGTARIPVDPQDYRAMVEAGVFFPPFHFNCRSFIVAVYGAWSVAENAAEFEQAVLESEYSYYVQKMDAVRELIKSIVPDEKGPKGSGYAAQIAAVDKVWGDLQPVIGEFSGVINFEKWRSGFEKKVMKLKSKTTPGSDGWKRQIVPNAESSLMELQSALWLRSNRHVILGFEFPIGTSNTDVIGKRSTDLDVISILDGVFCLSQVKAGDSSTRGLYKQMALTARIVEEQFKPENGPLVHFLETTGKSEFNNIMREQEQYDLLNDYLGNLNQLKFRIFGFGFKDRIENMALSSVIIKTDLITDAVVVVDISSLNSQVKRITKDGIEQ